jgi:hypothetical protein
MDSFDGYNMCNLCSSIPGKQCLPPDIKCENIGTEDKLDKKLKELYANDEDKLEKLETESNKFYRQSRNFANDTISVESKYTYLLGACKSYCNLFNIQ